MRSLGLYIKNNNIKKKKKTRSIQRMNYQLKNVLLSNIPEGH